ncbi:MAG: response regulator transcription factor [Bacteroidota bacterium]
MVKLAIVDDDSRLLESLRSHLENFDEIESVITSNSGLRFADQLSMMNAQQLPEVIIMDVSMGTVDEGIKATSIIKKQFPFIHIIMFTISDNDDLIFDAFKAGAMGYLLKNETPASILKAILDVKNGDAQMSPGVARKAINYLTKPAAPVEQSAEKLSPRELETINLVAKGYTYNQIAERLHISPATVKKHMTNIFSKLQVSNKVQAILKTEGFRSA